jgi:hypothetical protein
MRTIAMSSYPSLDVRLVLEEHDLRHLVAIRRGDVDLYLSPHVHLDDAETHYVGIKTTLRVLDVIESNKKGSH